MIRLAHVITGLSTGGAQTALLRLLLRMDRERFEPRVYSLSSWTGPIENEIKALGIPVRVLHMRATMPNPLAVLELSRCLRRQRVDLVQTWMYHADLVGGVAAKIASPRTPVIWGIHNGNLNPRAIDNGRTSYNARTLYVARTCARMSTWLPRVIVSCGYAARDMHSAIGYNRKKMTVIPNGFELQVFRPDPGARLRIRAELGISATATLVGCIGRFHPDKDPRNFVDAAARVRRQRPDVHFLLCGKGFSADNIELAQWVASANLNGGLHLLGERRDVPQVLAALDVAASPSRAEAFPSAVGEAMACGVPCVVTDVGDSAYMVGGTGRVVPPETPAALADAIHALLGNGTERLHALGLEARRRIEETFSIERMIRAYEETYTHVLQRA